MLQDLNWGMIVLNLGMDLSGLGMKIRLCLRRDEIIPCAIRGRVPCIV